MGALLADIVPVMGLGGASYGQSRVLFQLGRLPGKSDDQWVSDTIFFAHFDYRDMAAFATPKEVREAVVDNKLVWKRLQSGAINPDVSFLYFRHKNSTIMLIT